MRILITGGSGFAGKPLAARLAQDGHEVIVLTRDAQRASASLPAGVRAVGWDAHTTAGWGDLVDGAGAIVNLAGESLGGGPWTMARKQRILDSRLRAGEAVLEAIAKAAQKPGVLVQASAVGYYGTRGDEFVTETDPPGRVGFESTVCVQWEQCTRAAEDMGVRRTVVRTGLIFDRGGGVLPLMALPYKLFGGGPVGNGRQGVSWIHRDDWVSAVRFLLGEPRAGGSVNLTAPQPVTMDELGRALARALHRPHWLPVPAFAFRLALGELSDLLLEGRKAVPARLQEWGFAFKYPGIDAALQAIYGQA